MGGDEVIVYDLSGASAEPVAPAESAAPINITLDLGTELTHLQRAAITAVISAIEEASREILAGNVSPALNVTILLGKLVKAVENISVEGAKLRGADKKIVVLEVGKQLIRRLVPEEQRATVLSVYEMAAEPVLDTLVDVSRNVNVAAPAPASAPAVATVAAPVASLLCSCLASLLKRS